MALASALYGTRADRLAERLLRGYVPLILGYHRVVEDDGNGGNSLPGMRVSRQMLERHLDWLGRRFRFISLDELGAQMEGGEGFSEPVVAVTFDDGYSDVYHNAFPLLKRKGIPAAVFVVTGLVGSSSVPFFDRLYLLIAGAYSKWDSGGEGLGRLLLDLGIQMPGAENGSRTSLKHPYLATGLLLDTLPQEQLFRVMGALETHIKIETEALESLYPVTWEMLSEMHQAGITIGSHTQSHALLTNENFQKVLDETMLSRQDLERRLRTDVKHFAYPRGCFNPLVLSAVAAAGYEFGYTTCRHRDATYPLLTLPRKVLWENSCLDAFGRFSSSIMSCQVRQAFNWLDRCKQNHGRPWPPRLDLGETALVESKRG